MISKLKNYNTNRDKLFNSHTRVTHLQSRTIAEYRLDGNTQLVFRLLLEKFDAFNSYQIGYKQVDMAKGLFYWLSMNSFKKCMRKLSDLNIIKIEDILESDNKMKDFTNRVSEKYKKKLVLIPLEQWYLPKSICNKIVEAYWNDGDKSIKEFNVIDDNGIVSKYVVEYENQPIEQEEKIELIQDEVIEDVIKELSGWDKKKKLVKQEKLEGIEKQSRESARKKLEVIERNRKGE